MSVYKCVSIFVQDLNSFKNTAVFASAVATAVDNRLSFRKVQ